MDKFTASNGITVRVESRITGDRRFLFEVGEVAGVVEMTGPQMKALIETLDAERDEELGRWRWPFCSTLMVYRDESPDDVMVVDEVRPDEPHRFSRYSVSFDGPFGGAARAYFEAHPGRKPWEDAQEGEVWIVTPSKAFTLGEQINYPAIFQAGMFRDHGGSWGPEDLTAARRIWPEVSGG